MIAALGVVLLLVAWYLDWRTYHRRLEQICADHAAALALRNEEIASWRKIAKRWTRLYERAAADGREHHNALVVERSYSAACDRQLRAIREQVAGKCLWPTLGDDDVVVEMPKRSVIRSYQPGGVFR